MYKKMIIFDNRDQELKVVLKNVKLCRVFLEFANGNNKKRPKS